MTPASSAPSDRVRLMAPEVESAYTPLAPVRTHSMLPEVEKRAIQLVYLEGYTITQAAKIEGCRNESTLRMRLNRAKAKLGLNKKLEMLYRPDQSKKDTTKKDTTKKE